MKKKLFGFALATLFLALSVPVAAQQATKSDLGNNVKEAKQLGLTTLPNVLARADRVIR
jgi:hypothetical protein